MGKPSKLEYPPGVLKVDSQLAAMGRYIDADKIRFVQGKAQTIGGWNRWNSTPTPGVSRSMMAWTDVSGNNFLVVGSTHKLYVYKDGSTTPIDITPIVASGTAPTGLATNPFSTTSGSPIVSVAHTGHQLVVGQYVNFTGATAVGGITINGAYQVTSVTNANVYTITHSSNATSTAGPGGGSPAWSYEIPPGNINQVGVLTGGWGMGGWGMGAWGGLGAGALAGLGEPRFWSLDLWGSYLTANYTAGPLYYWDTVAPKAILVTGSPPSTMRRHVVTESRFILCLATDDPLRIQWQDQNTLTGWPVTVTGTAGERKLQGGTRIVNGCTVQGLGNLIWTDTHAFLITYTGSRFVFESQITGKDCGLVAPKAFAMANTVPYWLGPQAFHRWIGYVEDVPRQEEIWSWLEENLNPAQVIKTFAHYDADFGDVTWWFPGLTDDEPTKYLKLSLEDFSWTPGTMSRTAVTAFKTVETRPFMMDYAGYIYLHEAGTNADGADMPWYLQGAPIELEDGDLKYDINGYIPDFKRVQGTINIQLDAYNRIPEGDEAAPIETQVRGFDSSAAEGVVDFSANGRAIAVRLSSSSINTAMRLGTAKVDVVPRGRRR